MMCARYFGYILVSLFATASQAAVVQHARIWHQNDETRFVLDVSETTKFQSFRLDKPDRFVIDLEAKQSLAHFEKLKLENTHIRHIRVAKRTDSLYRIVIEPAENAAFHIFAIPPNQQNLSARIVVDLTQRNKIENPQTVTAVKTEKSAPKTNEVIAHDPVTAPIPLPESQEKLEKEAMLPPLPLPSYVPRRHEFVVAIDPGHGGTDPGAKGKNGTYEKDIVLAIAKRLHAHINDTPGMRSFLVRNNDTYIGLRQRMEHARKHGADLFVSVHADAFRHARAKGASVFVVSERGSSSEAARWLAQNENRSDLVGGLSLDDKSDVVASVLLDMSQSATKAASSQLASFILKELKQVTPLHKPNVEHAGFMVLKSPDIPSVLVETGFISHPQSEQNLKTSAHQEKIAAAIYEGIQHFVKTRPFLALNETSPTKTLAMLEPKPATPHVRKHSKRHK